MESFKAKESKMNGFRLGYKAATVAIAMSCLTNFVTPSVSHAGTKDGGGGGKGVVCRTGNNINVLLLDFWEAETVHKRAVPRTNEPVAKQVERALVSLANANEWRWIGSLHEANGKVFRGREFFLRKMMDLVPMFLNRPENSNIRYGNVKWLRDVVLKETPDSYERMRPRNCPIEQVVRYEDDLNEISIDADLVDKMSPTDFAGLVAHEVFYKVLRDEAKQIPEGNSLRVRRAVGLAFSGYNFQPVESLLPKDKSFLTCGRNGDTTRIYLIANSRLESMHCYQAIASSVSGHATLGVKIESLSSGSCPVKDDKIEEGIGRYYSVEDFKKLGFEEQEKHRKAFLSRRPVQSTSAIGSIIDYFTGASEVKTTEEKSTQAEYRLRYGFTFAIEEGAIARFDENGILEGRRQLAIKAGKNGLTAQVLDDKKNIVADDLPCF